MVHSSADLRRFSLPTALKNISGKLKTSLLRRLVWWWWWLDSLRGCIKIKCPSPVPKSMIAIRYFTVRNYVFERAFSRLLARKVDFFFGFGLSYVEATYAWGIRPNPDIYNNYGEAFYLQKTYMRSSGILPIQRFGLASSSDTFGFMLEFIRLPQRDLLDNPFKNQSFISSEAYNAAYNDRGGELPAKVGMGGMITRASWTYSFW